MPTQPNNTLSSSALTTLDQVKLYLGKDDLEADQDDRLTWLINVASTTVANYAQREFVSALGTASMPRPFEVRGSPVSAIISLAPFDLQSVASVTVANPSGTSVTLGAGYYQAGPIHRPYGVYSFMKLSAWMTPAPFAYSANLANIATVTGVWGWPSVPLDVENAVITTVLKWYQRDQSTPSPEFDLSPGFQEAPQGLNLPYDARVLLQPYKRSVMV